MKKKRTLSKKTTSKRERVHRTTSHSDSTHEKKIENILIENFVSLQKVMTNLSISFDNLANQISKLLELFEISAKALAEKDFSMDKSNKDSKKILEKVDSLLEQNKTIAKGIALMHEKIPEEETSAPTQRVVNPFGNFPPHGMVKEQGTDAEEYRKSISSPKTSPL